MPTDPRQDPAELVRAINRCWNENRPLEIAEFVRADAVMTVPAFGMRIAGRDAFVATFADYCSTCTTRSFDESELRAELFGDTAVVSFAFEIVYEREGGTWSSTGRDLWVLAREGGRWLAAWRAMIELAETEL